MELPCKIESLAQSKNSIVGFQMGASTQERRWPVVSFVELAKKLIDSAPSLQIKLIGSSRELELPEEFLLYYLKDIIKI